MYKSADERYMGRDVVTQDGSGCISFNMKGVNVQADVVVKGYTPVANPSLFEKAKMTLPNVARGSIKDDHFIEVGIVQILEYSRMEAVYRANTDTWMGQARNKTVLSWIQNKLPCYDCSTADIPWYNPTTARQEIDLSAAQPFPATLSNMWMNDYPQLNVDAYLKRPGHKNDGMPLYQIKKHNKFSVYLFMRELNNAKDKTLHRWILKKGTWTTKLVCKALNSDFKGHNTWVGNEYNPVGYRVIEDEIDIVEDDTWGTSAFYNLPQRGTYLDGNKKGGKKGANDDQYSYADVITPLTYWSIDK